MSDPAQFGFPANKRNTVSPNVPVQADCYTAPGTLHNVAQPHGTVPGGNVPAKAGDTVGLGNTRRFYAEDGVLEKDTP